jgi:hypothetical protein
VDRLGEVDFSRFLWCGLRRPWVGDSAVGHSHSGRRFTDADHCVHVALGQIVGPARSGKRGSPWTDLYH